MKAILLIVTVFLTVGCATAKPPPEPVFVETKQEHPKPQLPTIVPVPVTMVVPGQARPNPKMKIPTDADVKKAKRQSKGKTTATLIDEANKKAQAAPIDEGFYNAVQIYDYAPGVLYQLYAAPMRITSIQLGVGEKVTSVASGDTIRWIIGQTTAGEGASIREMVMVKPVRPNLRTNIIITTNHRIYQLEAQSFKETYMASVSWNYPTAIVNQASRKAPRSESDESIPMSTSVTGLNFDYHLVGDEDDLPSWTPIRVFDDGLKTYLQFRPEAKKRKMPALFLLSRDKKPQIVNYRVKGNYYIVDGLFEVAQLRLGEKSPRTIGIERRGGRQ